jgi:hypothetical protein
MGRTFFVHSRKYIRTILSLASTACSINVHYRISRRVVRLMSRSMHFHVEILPAFNSRQFLVV